MKLYLVERTNDYSYDDYSDFVCWANSADEAKQLHPSGDDFYEWQEDGWHYNYGEKEKAKYSSWPDDAASLKVWELSRAPEKPTVVCASFHAG